MTPFVVCYILAVHWLADFVFQSHWMAANKSKDNLALTCHVLTYTVTLAFFTLLLPWPAWHWFGFVLLNGIAHWCTDYCTSRLTSKLWAEQRWHDFFVVVGLDQLSHQMMLMLTAWRLLS